MSETNSCEMTIVMCDGVEGPSLYLNDYRICGPKPWGGGKALKTWNHVKRDHVMAAMGLESEDNTMLLFVISAIRHKTGIGDKPMLTELADTLADQQNLAASTITALQERVNVLEGLVRGFAALRLTNVNGGTDNA